MWALVLPDRPSADLTYRDALRAWHHALWTVGVPCDIVPTPGEQRLLLVPSLYALSTATARALEDYVARGGHLVVGPFSGVVDPDDRVHPGPYPGALRGLLGLRVDEYLPLAAAETATLDDGSTGRIWAERVIPDPGTEVEALLPEWAAQAGCTTPPIHGAGRGVEVTRRTAPDGRSWLFAINHTRHAALVAETITVQAGSFAVLRE